MPLPSSSNNAIADSYAVHTSSADRLVHLTVDDVAGDNHEPKVTDESTLSSSATGANGWSYRVADEWGVQRGEAAFSVLPRKDESLPRPVLPVESRLWRIEPPLEA